MTAQNRPADHTVELDDVHAAAVEAACDLDRQFAADHPGIRTYVRKGIRHELCVPGDAFRWPRSVRVYFLADGVRIRQELWV